MSRETPPDLKVAIVHNMFWKMRGAEKAVLQILKIYPDADIYCLFGLTGCDLEREFPPEIALKKINYSFLQKIPGIRSLYRATTPFWPIATEMFDLSTYDLVISSSSTTVKGVITSPGSTHVSYIYSPMRYIWDQKDLYLEGRGFFTRNIFRTLSNYLRIWDVTSNTRIDHMITISQFVADRIEKFYRVKPDAIIYPPVDVTKLQSMNKFKNSEKIQLVMISPFQENKGARSAIDFAIKNQTKLVLIGDGPDKDNLYKKYSDSQFVEFTGWISDNELYKKVAESTAMLFLGVEDFGIAPVESAMLGTPVIALARGGALESVKNGVSGVYIDQISDKALTEALTVVKNTNWDKDAMMAFAKTFSAENFRNSFKAEVEKAIKLKDGADEI